MAPHPRQKGVTTIEGVFKVVYIPAKGGKQLALMQKIKQCAVDKYHLLITKNTLLPELIKL